MRCINGDGKPRIPGFAMCRDCLLRLNPWHPDRLRYESLGAPDGALPVEVASRGLVVSTLSGGRTASTAPKSSKTVIPSTALVSLSSSTGHPPSLSSSPSPSSSLSLQPSSRPRSSAPQRGSGNVILSTVQKLTSNPRPRLALGGTQILIGVTDRDSGGVQNQLDQMLVAFGTSCRVVVVRQIEDIQRVHAFFIPGGMADLPETLDESGAMIPASGLRQDRNAEAWSQRVRLQRTIVQFAITNNVPILGVCGGSRCLAQGVYGGATQYLTSTERGTHNRHFGEPWNVAHQVTIQPRTTLARVASGGHYRTGPDVTTVTTLSVNSMHWASSVFSVQARVTASAYGGVVLEAWELQSHHFFLGIQWHPEFAQLPHGDFSKSSAPHLHIMNALGQAAIEGLAARILQRHWRRRLLLKVMPDFVRALRAVRQAESYKAQTPPRRGELDHPKVLAILQAIRAIGDFLDRTEEHRGTEVAMLRAQAVRWIIPLVLSARADNGIGYDDSLAIEFEADAVIGGGLSVALRHYFDPRLK